MEKLGYKKAGSSRVIDFFCLFLLTPQDQSLTGLGNQNRSLAIKLCLLSRNFLFLNWMQQLAIFGGTFDPIHWGHLLIAEAALAQLQMKRLIWVPSINPPHKQATAFEHRLAMLKLATRNNPAFTVSLIEKERLGNSYAINTLINLSDCYPNTHWYWIIGLDAFQTLPLWYRGKELAQMCDWLIAPRPVGAETISQSESVCKQVEQKFKEFSCTISWQLLHTPLVRVSSSQIREICRQGVSIEDLVPESVRCYITSHQLYSHNAE